jgi:cytochrome c oxidase subunit IV
MSTDTATAAHEAHDEHGHEFGFASAIKVAIFLGIVTALETATHFWDFGAIAEPMIIVLMIIKFAVVVAYFMHLKFDNKIFSYLFVAGVVLAISVYMALLVTFNWF